MPKSATDAIMKEITGSEEEEEEKRAAATSEKEDSDDEEVVEHGTDTGGKKKKKPAEPVVIPLPEDFDRHDKWKPEPFCAGENFKTTWCEIRARKAEEADKEIRGVLSKHVSAGLWPRGMLEITSRQAVVLRKASNAAKTECIKQQEASQKSAAERADEKKKQIDALKASLGNAFSYELHAEANNDVSLTDRFEMGKKAAIKVFTDMAPKINSWKESARAKAIEAAKASAGMSDEEATSILTAQAEEAAKSSPNVGSPSAKKRAAEDDMNISAEDLVTPVKPKKDGAESPSAPSQTDKHQKAKNKKLKSSPTGIELEY